MILQNRLKDPGAMMSIGLTCLAVANCLRFLHLTAYLGPDLIDGVHGLLLGVSIGMILWSVRLAARQRRCGES